MAMPIYIVAFLNFSSLHIPLKLVFNEIREA